MSENWDNFSSLYEEQHNSSANNSSGGDISHVPDIFISIVDEWLEEQDNNGMQDEGDLADDVEGPANGPTPGQIAFDEGTGVQTSSEESEIPVLPEEDTMWNIDDWNPSSTPLPNDRHVGERLTTAIFEMQPSQGNQLTALEQKKKDERRETNRRSAKRSRDRKKKERLDIKAKNQILTAENTRLKRVNRKYKEVCRLGEAIINIIQQERNNGSAFHEVPEISPQPETWETAMELVESIINDPPKHKETDSAHVGITRQEIGSINSNLNSTVLTSYTTSYTNTTSFEQVNLNANVIGTGGQDSVNFHTGMKPMETCGVKNMGRQPSIAMDITLSEINNNREGIQNNVFPSDNRAISSAWAVGTNQEEEDDVLCLVKSFINDS